MVYIALICKEDILFAAIAQGARVDGAILPSGLKVPVSPGKLWIIRGNYIHCEDLPATPE